MARLVAFTSWILALTALPAAAACPPAHTSLGEIDFEATARVSRFDATPPPELWEKAVEEPGEIMVSREGKAGHALALVELPVERLWKAINDEDHQAGFLVDESRVVAGTPRGRSRLLLQAMSRLGVGRFWVDRVEMSRELYEASGGRLWELTWKDDFQAVDLESSPIREVAAEHRPVEWTRGAWLFVPLGPECTWIDYYVESDPGGMLSSFQALGAKKALREAVEGLLRMAREHVPQPHPNARFVRPDGEVLP